MDKITLFVVPCHVKILPDFSGNFQIPESKHSTNKMNKNKDKREEKSDKY